MSERSLQRGLRARQVGVQTYEMQRMPKGKLSLAFEPEGVGSVSKSLCGFSARAISHSRRLPRSGFGI